MRPNLSKFVEQLRPFLSQEIERMDWGRDSDGRYWGPPGYQTIKATFPRGRDDYYCKLTWYYEVDADRMFRFGLETDDGIYYTDLSCPEAYLDAILKERAYFINAILHYRIRMDKSGPWLEIGSLLSLDIFCEKDPILLNLAVAGFHGEDISNYFLDRVLELDGSLSEQISKDVKFKALEGIANATARLHQPQ